MKKFLSNLSHNNAPASRGSQEKEQQNPFIGKSISFGAITVQINSLIAEGGYSYVFLATDQATGGRFAVKRMVVGKENVVLVKNEIAVHKKFSGHRNILRLYDSMQRRLGGDGDPQEFWLLMEYCPDNLLNTLNQHLRTGLSEDFVLSSFSSVCEAVAHMHSMDPPIIHRDIKVENVLIDSKGVLKLCDFGSCTTQVMYPGRPGSSREAMEEEIQRLTTLAYRSPEMVDLFTNQPISEKLDIWALGCVLYKICYMVPPFGESAMQIASGKFTIPKPNKFSAHITDLLKFIFVTDPSKRPDIFDLCEWISAIRGVPCPVKNERLLRVTSMFPDLPVDLLKANLFESRSVEVTLDNVLTGKLILEEPKPPANPSPSANRHSRSGSSGTFWNQFPNQAISASHSQISTSPGQRTNQNLAPVNQIANQDTGVESSGSRGSRRRERPRPRNSADTSGDHLSINAPTAAVQSMPNLQQLPNTDDPFKPTGTDGAIRFPDPFSDSRSTASFDASNTSDPFAPTQGGQFFSNPFADDFATSFSNVNLNASPQPATSDEQPKEPTPPRMEVDASKEDISAARTLSENSAQSQDFGTTQAPHKEPANGPTHHLPSSSPIPPPRPPKSKGLVARIQAEKATQN